MTDMIDRTADVAALVQAPVSRRGFFASCGAASAAGAAMVALPSAALGATGTRTFEGKYVLGANPVHGFFAIPRGQADLDVVVIVPGKGKLTAATRALARRHAAQGRLAVVPDLHATYGGTTLELAAMKAALVADKARFRRHPQGSNRVTFVAA